MSKTYNRYFPITATEVHQALEFAKLPKPDYRVCEEWTETERVQTYNFAIDYGNDRNAQKPEYIVPEVYREWYGRR